MLILNVKIVFSNALPQIPKSGIFGSKIKSREWWFQIWQQYFKFHPKYTQIRHFGSNFLHLCTKPLNQTNLRELISNMTNLGVFIFVGNIAYSLTHWSNLFENFFRLLIWELMDATPTNNRSVVPRTTVTLSHNTPDCICLWALPSSCCQRFDHLFVWILSFDLPGLVRPARSWSFRQYSS